MYHLSLIILFLTILFPFDNLLFSQKWEWGSYTGNGVDDRTISVSFQPDAVIVRQAGTNYDTYIRTNNMLDGDCYSAISTTNPRTNVIQSFNSSGFVVGSATGANNSGSTYYFQAFKSDSYIEVGTYTGNGTGQRDIALSGAFRPKFVFLASGNGGRAFMQLETTSGEFKAVNFLGGGGTTITSSYASGFTVHSTNNTNTYPYYYVAIKSMSNGVGIGSYVGDGAASHQVTGLSFQPGFLFISSFSGSARGYFRDDNMAADYSVCYYPTGGTLTTTGIRSFSSDRFTVGTDQYINWSGTTFYYFSLANPSALPVKLLNFNAQCRNNGEKVVFNWETASEFNNDYFTLEQSTDCIHYKPVADIQGSGKSNTIKEYSYTYNEPNSDEIMYYRIRQTDYNGKSEPFNPITVNCNKPEISDIVIHPNPVSGSILEFVFYYHSDMEINYTISNISGMVIKNGTLVVRKGSNLFRIDIDHLSGGHYFLILNNGFLFVNAKFQKL